MYGCFPSRFRFLRQMTYLGIEENPNHINLDETNFTPDTQATYQVPAAFVLALLPNFYASMAAGKNYDLAK